MGFSQDELRTMGDSIPPGCSVRIEWGHCWLEMPARERDGFGPADWFPPGSSVRFEWRGCWLEMSVWEGNCFGSADWFPPGCSVRIKWGDCWLEMSAWEGDCFGPADWFPPGCSVRIEWGDCWLEMSVWEGNCFGPVFDSLGSENMTRLTKIPVSPYPSSRCLAVPAGSITGSKRRIRETSFCHSAERLFCSRCSEGPSKKLRQLGHQIHHNWHVACNCDSNIRKPRPKSVGKDCDNRKTSASKSCEGHSQYLRFRTMNRIPSDLDSLLSWNSFAFANVCTSFAVFGLGPNCCFRVREQSVFGEKISVKVIRNKATSTGWNSVLNDFREHIVELRRVCWFRKRQQSVPSETISVGANSKKPTTWDSLPNDLQANVLKKLDFRDLSRFKTLSNSWKKFIEGEAFRHSRGDNSEGEFTAINYYIKNKSWRCSGYDLHSRSWRSFPPMSYLPPPDPELFKEYSVCGHGGLMCAEVSKLPKKGELVVFNPLTGETRALPPLLHPRNPVLVHISVDSAKKSYKVIVAGSSAASDEHLSRKVEVFESSTSKWKEVCDLPGPAFGLNEHQAGVSLNGKLFLISFLESGGRGVVALDVENGTWLQDLTTPIPWSSYSNTLQLVESDGRLFVFSEQEPDQSVDHCIDELEFPDPEAGVLTCRWRNVVKAKKLGGRGLQVYPEHTCVGFGEGKLCIFNTLSRDGVVYDLRDGKKCEYLVPPPANQMGDDNFFSLNPASFTLQPNFSMSVETDLEHELHCEKASLVEVCRRKFPCVASLQKKWMDALPWHSMCTLVPIAAIT